MCNKMLFYVWFSSSFNFTPDYRLKAIQSWDERQPALGKYFGIWEENGVGATFLEGENWGKIVKISPNVR